MPPQVPNAPASPYLTKRETAAYLRRSERSIDRLPLKRIKLGGRVLFDRASVDAALKAIEL